MHYSPPASGGPTNKFKNWNRGEPAARRVKNNNCVMAHAGVHNVGTWANVECKFTTGYVCEAQTST